MGIVTFLLSNFAVDMDQSIELQLYRTSMFEHRIHRMCFVKQDELL